MKVTTPPEKSHPPLFPCNPPLKVEVLSSPPFWKFGWRLNPPAERGGGGGGAHYVSPSRLTSRRCLLIFRKTHVGFISCWKFYLNFSQTCIFQHDIGKFSYLQCSAYWKMHLEVKVESRHFYLCFPRQKSPPVSYHHSPSKGKWLIPQAGFLSKSVSPNRNGKGNYEKSNK